MQAVLALRGIAAGVIRRGRQSALHRLANLDVLELDLVAERDRLVDLLAHRIGIAEEPLEHRPRAALPEGEDEVRREIVGIDVQHQVRIDPVVADLIAANALGAFQRRVLDREPRLRLRPVLRVIELTEERRMHDRDVIALEVVVDVDLPVAGQLPLFARGEAIATEVVAHDRAEEFGERGDLMRDRDEEQIAPFLDAELRQARLPEILHAFELGRAEERAIEVVGPAVIAALQDGGFPLPFRDRTGAVAADVRHRAEHAVVAAHDQHRLGADGGGEELSRLARLLRAAGELPDRAEYIAVLLLEHAWIEVVARRNRRCVFEPLVEFPRPFAILAGVIPSEAEGSPAAALSLLREGMPRLRSA